MDKQLVKWAIMVVAALFAILAVYIIFVPKAEAQSSSAGTANSQSSATVNGEASAQSSSQGGNANNALYIDQRSGGSTRNETRHSGDYTVRSAPAVQPPSVGGGHPCAYGRASGGLSVIGGGVSGTAGQQIDYACMFAQMGMQEEAIILLAQDEAACKALRQTGRINSDAACSDAERNAKAKQQREAAKAAGKPTPAPVKCVRVTLADGRTGIQPQYQRGVSPEEAIAFCEARR